MMILYVLVALVLLGVLITVHEFGHFAAARALGIPVKEFSVGFGPKIYQRQSRKTGTLLSLILMHPDRPDFHFHGVSPQGECDVDTREIRQAAGGLPLNEPAIAAWLQEAVYEEINPIFGGANL